VARDPEQEVAVFNSKYDEGHLGFLRKDDGTEVPTILKSRAWALGGHTAVAMFDGMSGCYRIDRFTPMR
jgi:hypothetical protein